MSGWMMSDGCMQGFSESGVGVWEALLHFHMSTNTRKGRDISGCDVVVGRRRRSGSSSIRSGQREVSLGAAGEAR